MFSCQVLASPVSYRTQYLAFVIQSKFPTWSSSGINVSISRICADSSMSTLSYYNSTRTEWRKDSFKLNRLATVKQTSKTKWILIRFKPAKTFQNTALITFFVEINYSSKSPQLWALCYGNLVKFSSPWIQAPQGLSSWVRHGYKSWLWS